MGFLCVSTDFFVKLKFKQINELKKIASVAAFDIILAFL